MTQSMREPQQFADTLDVSVILPAYNGASVIGNQLDALARQQTTLKWEVIVADNGSTDATADVVRQRAASFPVTMRLVDGSHRRGPGSARNAGVRASGGDILLFCDSDDEVMPGWLRAAWVGLQQFDLVGGPLHELRDPRDPNAPATNPGTLEGGLDVLFARTCNLGVRRNLFFRVGGFDESFPPYGCEDAEFAIRVREAGGIAGFVADMRIYYRDTTEVRAAARKAYLTSMARTLMWERHPPLFADRLGPAAAWRALRAWPAHLIHELVATKRPNARALARDLIFRIANVRAYQTLLKGGRVPDPILLTPADDPLRQTAPSLPTVAVAEDNHDH